MILCAKIGEEVVLYDVRLHHLRAALEAQLGPDVELADPITFAKPAGLGRYENWVRLPVCNKKKVCNTFDICFISTTLNRTTYHPGIPLLFWLEGSLITTSLH